MDLPNIATLARAECNLFLVFPSRTRLPPGEMSNSSLKTTLFFKGDVTGERTFLARPNVDLGLVAEAATARTGVSLAGVFKVDLRLDLVAEAAPARKGVSLAGVFRAAESASASFLSSSSTLQQMMRQDNKQ